MSAKSAPVIAINGGSSSIKFAVFDAANFQKRLLAGAISRIGVEGTIFHVEGDAKTQREAFKQALPKADFQSASKFLLDWLAENFELRSLQAVGHRIVHGGPDFSEPLIVTRENSLRLSELRAFAPEHLPAEVDLIEAFRQRVPALPQVACFDTYFHRHLPRVARVFAIPRSYEAKGIKRYGFHGLSYEFLMDELAKQAGEPAASGRVILAHLGNGVSLAAVCDRKSMDTTMSFTPLSGVPMGTRSGDLDPGIAAYLERTEGLSCANFARMANVESGLRGLSETSSDMHDLLQLEAQDLRASEAIALFCYEVKKAIGSYAAVLGGVDALVFAGGIGENAPDVRARICDGLDFLGISIDEEKNCGAPRADGSHPISKTGSQVVVRVIRTDEERMIARTTSRVLGIH